VAGDDVGTAVAGTVDVARAGQHEVLEVVAQGEADRGAHGVDAVGLDDAVAGGIDLVEIVAFAADEEVGPAAAVDGIVAGTAVQRVGGAVATQDVAERGADQVGDARQRVPGRVAAGTGTV